MDRDEIHYITKRVRQQIKDIVPITDKTVVEKYNISSFRRVVVIVGSSRGGTSLFFDTLRQHPDVSSPDGEHGKYYTLNNIAYPFHASDYIADDTFFSPELLWFMLLDVGRTKTDGTDENHFIDNFIVRLPMQFYYRNFNYRMIKDEYLQDPSDFTKVVDRAGIMKRYYDLMSVGMENAEAFNPLSDFYIAETPFIFPHRNKRALVEDDFEDSTLVIKTSVDAYRLGWVRKLFPNSDLKVIHLTRNPGAAMNGLIDGWLTNRGFFTYMVPDINISGYPRDDLWNYDLPPNWPELLSEDLVTVVWHQWAQAHDHILSSTGEDSLKVKFEDFLYDRHDTLMNVLDFIGLSTDDPFFKERSHQLNQVMTTQSPRMYRWLARRDPILSVIQEHDNGIVEEVGYHLNECLTKWF